MGIIKAKLDEEWSDRLASLENIAASKNVFKVRDIIEAFYINLVRSIDDGSELYPTGNVEFDTYVAAIVSEMVGLKNLLGVSYSEFVNWRRP
jgi:hypothetical protein